MVGFHLSNKPTMTMPYHVILLCFVLRFSSAQLVEEFERIATYLPKSLVTSANAQDLDLRLFSLELAEGTNDAFDTAMRVYEEGAFSYPIAVLDLDSPLPEDVEEGELVIGVSPDGDYEIRGTVDVSAPADSTSLRVRYETNDVQGSYVGCLVAANPIPITGGCFMSEGFVVLSNNSSEPVDYEYRILKDNISGRSIATMSLEAGAKFSQYQEFKKFRDYYGVTYYADKWIKAATSGDKTNFVNGDADFSPYGQEGKYEALTKGASFLTFWMYSIGEMESALEVCESPGRDLDVAVNTFDRAVAFYTGSLEGEAGNGDGILMFNLADKRCTQFRTCGVDGNLRIGTSYVNHKVFDEFTIGQSQLVKGNCTAAREAKDRAVQLMTIPLIQSALLFAHLQSEGNDSESAEAQGATFAASILPMIHACEPLGRADAAIIYENLKTGHGDTSNTFSDIKRAFERNYECLGITCSEVGGIWDFAEGGYLPGADPCSREEKKSVALIATGISLGGIGLVGAVVLIATMIRRKSSTPPMMVDETTEIA